MRRESRRTLPDRRRATLRRGRAGIVMLAGFAVAITLAPAEAPATIEQQRARLPAPAKCRDPVAGVWRSHAYNEMWEEWNVFTLSVKRKDGSETELEGTVTNEAWYGPESEEQRGRCEGRLQYLVSMPGEGKVVNGRIDFGGVREWKLEEVFCGDFDGGYNLDQFSGQIDPDRLEFQSVNNDGGRFVNVPTVFRRIKCLDGPEDEEEIAVTVAPPPFYPPEGASGCGCTL